MKVDEAMRDESKQSPAEALLSTAIERQVCKASHVTGMHASWPRPPAEPWGEAPYRVDLVYPGAQRAEH